MPRIRSRRRRSRIDADRLSGHLEPGARQPRGDDGPDEGRRVELGRRRDLGRGVEARDLHQVVDQRAEARHVANEQLAAAPAIRRQRVEVVVQERRLLHERGHRRAQLVRYVGDERALLVLGKLQLPHGPFQRRSHPVERGRPRPELVARIDRQASGQVSRRDAPGRIARIADGPQDPAREEPRRERREAGQDQAADEQRLPELGDRGLGPGRVEQEVERRAAVRAPGPRDEVRRAVQVQPLEPDLAALDQRAQLRRQLRKRVCGDEPGRQRIAVAEVDDRAHPAAQLEGLDEAGVDDVLLRRIGGQHLVREHAHVEVGLGDGLFLLLPAQGRGDIEVRARTEDDRGQRDEADDRDQQPPADTPHRRLTCSPCSRLRGR